MATITTSQFLDNGTGRTAGEAWTLNSGAVLTVRTDSRWHANAPASMTGSFGSVTVNEGEWLIDARNVRWMAYTGGSGNSPAIGTTVSQGGVSGYFLGVWASLTSAPTAVGAAIPASGFIKFREVVGGVFSAGVLTGISATASGPDVTGWIEIVHDQAANITIPRLGKYTTRGDWFYLENTTGTRGQVLQAPTNGGGANTMYTGVEIETAPSSGIYERYTALRTFTNGWTIQHLGVARGTADKRQKYVKMLDGGQMQIGEQFTQTGTYAYLASQVSTYASNTRAGYYFREGNVVTVYCSGGHFLVDGQQVGFDATSGTATDGNVTATVLDPYYFTFAQTGANTEGTCNCRESVAITFTAHGLLTGERVYLTPTTGTLPAGEYTVVGVPSANAYWVQYAHTAALTSGSTGALHTITITTSAAHALAVGMTVDIDFTTGTAVDGVYVVRTVPTTTTYTINCPLSATTSGNHTSYFDVGYVPPAGCKTRIPNIIGMECSTGTRATNNSPNGTLATRPEFATTSAGSIDIEYLNACNWYFAFNQAYSVRMINSWTMDSVSLTECATAFTIDGFICGMFGALDTRVLQLSSNFAGGVLRHASLKRGNAPGTTDHACEINYSNNINLEDVELSIVQYVRSTGYPLNIQYCSGITGNDVRVMNGQLSILNSTGFTISNIDYCDRVNGKTNGTSATSAITIDGASSNMVFNGLTFGLNWSVLDCHPNTGAVRLSNGTNNITFRNLGTPAAKMKGGTWARNAYVMSQIITTGGNCYNYRIQNAYIDWTRSSFLGTVNSDKNVTFENVLKQDLYITSTRAIDAMLIANLNCYVKGSGILPSVATNASVYGTHFQILSGSGCGKIYLALNEPTTETASYFQSVVGTAKFNSSGGVILQTVGDQSIWETPYFVKGISGFDDYIAPSMSGGTATNYIVEYQIDTGSGYSGWKNLNRHKVVASGTSGQPTITIADTTGIALGDYIYSGTNLPYRSKVINIVGTTITMSKNNRGAASGTIYLNQLPSETIDPAVGFKLKLRISTIATATAAITGFQFSTISTMADKTNNPYPLDSITLSLTGLQSDSDVVILQAGTSNILTSVDSYVGTTWAYVYETVQNVDIGIIKPGYVPLYIRNYALGTSNASLPVAQTIDRNYA